MMSNDGYGKDIGYVVGRDGSLDLQISNSGDIVIIGGVGNDSLAAKRTNAIQQIILRLITPHGTLTDQNSESVDYGSSLYSLVGSKNTALNRMTVKAYVMAALTEYDALESIRRLDVEFKDGLVKIILSVKLKNDNEIIEQTINVGG